MQVALQRGKRISSATDETVGYRLYCVPVVSGRGQHASSVVAVGYIIRVRSSQKTLIIPHRAIQLN